ncbi:MAG TPA: AAA family ATPase [Acidimicrobiales bacterium]|nr:AAA family ATPase [Acidimicrobiales bacterium]
MTDAFSKRSSEIDEAMESEGFTSYRARGIAARATRAAKTDESGDSLLLRWLNELDALGWPSRKLAERLPLVNQRQHRPLRRLSATERAEMVRGLLAGPLAEQKVFTRADVVRLAAPALYGAAPEELDTVVAGVLAHPEAIALVGTPGARSRAYVAASVLAAEAAVEEVAARLAGADDRTSLRRATVEVAVAEKEERLGRPLTAGQRRAVAVICGSGRGIDVAVGVAGSGKTTALEVVRAAFEADGYRVLGTAVSGQAARALSTEAGVDLRTVASLVWRLEHGTLTLDADTLLLIDEAGMADDAQLLKLLVAAEAAGAKAVAIGDHHQLGAVGPGGGLEALVARHHPAVVVLDQNVRQRDPAERSALEQLRAGDVAKAVAWYRDNDRIVAAPDRADALDAAVDAWDADRRAGHEVALLAWRRRDVAALNERARRRCLEAGVVTGPEVEGPGGRRYAVGDRVVFLGPGDGRWVTSERASVEGVGDGRLTVAFNDGRREDLAGGDLGADHLDYAYALTVHRTQAATVDRAHVLADGGGRELAYVAMSRARGASHVYVVADDIDQAAEDLTAEWRREARQRWVLDTDEVAGGDGRRRPDLAQRTDAAVRPARLRAEREAVAAVAPDAEARLRVLDAQLRLERVAQPKPAARALGRR